MVKETSPLDTSCSYARTPPFPAVKRGVLVPTCTPQIDREHRAGHNADAMGGAEGKTRPGRQVDALIVTAIKLEYDNVLKVDAGAWPGSSWEVRRGPLGFDVAFRTFKGANEQPLEVAVTWTVDMGGVATALTAGPLIEAYSPRCIAMCGVCAGRRGDVNVGDVIIADRLWMYDTSKLKVELGEDDERIERVQGDMLMYPCRVDWKQRAEAFVVPAEAQTWLDERPPICEAQADWILERLAKSEDPRSHPDLGLKAPDLGEVLTLLWKKKLVDDGTLSLSATGRARIERLLLVHHRGLPGPDPFKVADNRPDLQRGAQGPRPRDGGGGHVPLQPAPVPRKARPRAQRRAPRAAGQGSSPSR